MPKYEEWKTQDDEIRYKINRANLRNCPHIAAWHFHLRFRTFMKYVLIPKFGIKDYWFRYEFQGRGSTHVHGFAWFEPVVAPEVQQAPLNEESRRLFTEFWSKHIFSVNPDPNRTPPARRSRGTYNTSSTELANTFLDLSDVINRTQKHACSEAYCLRKRKRTQADGAAELPRFCRFYFPRETGPAKTDKSRNPQYYTFCAASNDSMLNQSNPTIALGWRANTDIQPCTDLRAVVGYIAKYCAKDETPSVPYADIARTLIPYVNETHPELSFATKIVNRLIGERDWSAQEVSHLLFGIPLFSSSRQVITFNCRPEEEVTIVIDFDQDTEATGGQSILLKYKGRRAIYEDTTLLTFLRSFEHGARKVHKPRPQAKDRVVVYQPSYKSSPTHHDYPDYCRTKIALHHPFKEYPSLPWNGCETWPAAYEHCKANCVRGHEPDHMQPLDVPVPEDEFEFEREPSQDEHDPMALIAGQTVHRNPAEQDENPDNLGGRQVDWVRYWEDHVNTHRGVGPPGMPDIYEGCNNNWWKRAREIAPAAEATLLSPHIVDRLAPEQWLIYDKVMHHHRHGGPQLLLNIDGRAGTGKSFIIKVLSAYLTDASGREDTIQICAPTGAAAFGISGSTAHRLLNLPVNKDLEYLSTRELRSLQANLRHTKYLIIDEKSMIGLPTIQQIDFRLREAKNPNQRFGGMNILLFGDFWQLAPVRAKAMFYSPLPGYEPLGAAAQIPSQSHAPHLETERLPRRRPKIPIDEALAVELYRAFDQTIELIVQQRQDPSQVAFASALEGLRNSTMTVADWETLTSRCKANLTTNEIDSFDEAIHVYHTNEEVARYNHTCQRDSGLPVFKVLGDHSDRIAENADPYDLGQLEPYLELSIGCKLMLLENIWTERGLVNGTQCRLFDIVWPEDSDPCKQPDPDQPLCLLIGLPVTVYTGPSVQEYEWNGEQYAVIPIYRSQREAYIESALRHRSQFPVRLAYAITIHKSQGMTMPKIVLNIARGRKEMALFYVAASRVRRLEDIMFEESFDLERVTAGETSISTMRRIDWIRRSLQRLIASNEASTAELRRRGPSQPSQAVARAASGATGGNASQRYPSL